jgi:ketosteroid isomerase-like protein
MIRKMKKGKRLSGIAVAAFAGILIFSACSNLKKEKMISDLMETDLAFSEMSSDKGIKRAFENYIDTSAIVFNANFNPIDGKNAAIEHFRNLTDSGYVISWKPIGADIVSSGNMGYTYGIYQIASIDSVAKGTYISVWKKSKNGSWKLVLDSDNNDLRKIN